MASDTQFFEGNKKRLPILKFNLKRGTVQEIPRIETPDKENASSPFQRSISEMVKKRKRNCTKSLLKPSKISKVHRHNKHKSLNKEKKEDNFLEKFIDELQDFDGKGILPELSELDHYLFNNESVVRNEGNDNNLSSTR
ncbi:hypothetical protein CDAR_457721 [Caerostris darwini]|uniref:Uncharacterized protein n=1 Tax=Caerostris darwini TaxID=1538125 RepID=A0AAV4S5X0_9ARAC|nr:hypothetical protein CDAR_457721 [Caerostris darwini]